MISKLPLLQKELIEYASQKRSYFLRIIYGLILYSIFLYNWDDITGRSVAHMLGRGRYLLETIYIANIVLIFLFLPTASAALIVTEKEKQTLPLLMICKIPSFLIIIEKFFSAMLSVISLILISLPLIYLSYLLGGVTQEKIIASIYCMGLTILQVAAIGIMFSCYCKSLAEALISTYIFGFILYIFTPFLSNFFYLSNYQEIIFFPPAFFVLQYSLENILAYTIPIWISILVFLGMAFYFFYKQQYTHVASTNKIELLKEKLKGFYKVKTHKKKLSFTLPIYWREAGKIRLRSYFIICGLVIIVALLISIIARRGDQKDLMLGIYLFTFAVCALIILMKGSLLFAKERKQQTWDILLTTPLTSNQIFWQKVLSGVRINMFAVLTLIWIMLVYSIFFYNRSYYYYGNGNISWSTFVMDNIISIFLVMTATQWVAILVGLRFRTSSKVPLICLIIFVAWCVLPIVVYESMPYYSDTKKFIELISPASFILLTMDRKLPGFYDAPHVGVSYSIIIYMLIIGILIGFCAIKNERYLRGDKQ